METFKRIYIYSWPKRGIAFHSMLKFCGHECVTGNYNWNGLKRGGTDFILWQHTVAGEGSLIYEGREYRLKAGDSMLVHMPHDHIYFIPEDSAFWEFKFVGFCGRELIRIAREIERFNGPVLKLGENADPIRILNSGIEMAAQNLIRGPATASSLASQMINSLAESVNYGEIQSSFPPQITRAIDFCLNAPGILPTVAEMAEAAKLSRFHFSREFKAATGKKPSEFIREHALRRAAGMLQTGSFSVKEIALISGFSSESVFCRAYKRVYGISPGRHKSIY